MHHIRTMPTEGGAFDAARWLARADRYGYTIYAWDPRGAGNFDVVTLEPVLRGVKRHRRDLSLWQEFRSAEGNIRLVCDHLVQTGCVRVGGGS